MRTDAATVYFGASPILRASGDRGSGVGLAPYPDWPAQRREARTGDQYSYTVLSYNASPPTLAHELGHLLTRQFDEENPEYIPFPQTFDVSSTDYSVNSYRRFSEATVRKARQVSTQSGLLQQ